MSHAKGDRKSDTGLLRMSALLSLLSLLLWSACGDPPTPCKTDAQCLNGFYCAQTDKESKFCVKRLTGSDASPDQATPPGDRTNPPDQTNPPGDRGNPPDDVITPPDDKPPTGCIPPPYDASKDPGNGGKSVQLDNLDKAFFKTLRLIYHASRTCNDAIWGGKYEMHKIPTFVVNIGSGEAGKGKGVRGFLINHPSPPSGTTKIDSKLVFGLTNVYLHNADKTKVTEPGFDFAMPIGGIKTYAFEYGSSDDFINPLRGREVFAFFVHEGFHRAQEFEESWGQAPGNQDTTNYPTDANTLALAMLEGRILVAGYKGADPTTQLKRFLAVQTQRFQADPSGTLEAHDALQEWLEGTAQYAEHHYVKVIGMPYPDDDINSVVSRLTSLEELTGDPSYTPTKEDLLSFITARFYATGAIIGILLDRSGDKTWRNQIRQGKRFYDILKAKYPSINTTQLTTESKNQYSYSQLQTLGNTYSKLK